MDRNLALEFIRVTEAGAISSARWIGKGDKHAADKAAVDEMRKRLNMINFSATVVIGEGTKDKAPMLYNGERVGNARNPVMDLAIDPLECTDSVAYGRYNAISVIATGSRGSLFNAPDTYMEKIAVGAQAKGVIDLDASINTNIRRVAKVLDKNVEDVTVIILDRERHKNLITEVRRAGARVRLITDGDVAAGIAPCLPETNVDMLMGIGGSTEAVLAAVAIKILGGELICRFTPQNDIQVQELKNKRLSTKKIYHESDLAKGKDLSFTATGVIEGPLLPGVTFQKNSIITHSMVVRGRSGTVRYITTHHHYYA